jgi:hypothetical protein
VKVKHDRDKAGWLHPYRRLHNIFLPEHLNAAWKSFRNQCNVHDNPLHARLFASSSVPCTFYFSALNSLILVFMKLASSSIVVSSTVNVIEAFPVLVFFPSLSQASPGKQFLLSVQLTKKCKNKVRVMLEIH